MADAEVKYRMKAEDGQAFEAFMRLSRAERQMVLEGKRASKELKNQGTNAEFAASGMAKLGLSMIGISSGIDVLRKGADLLVAYKDALDAMGKQSATTSEQIKSFLSILPSGPEGQKFAAEVMQKGAAMGVAPGPASVLAEPIVSKLNLGDIAITPEEKAQILGAYEAALKGAFIGIPSELAGKVEVGGASRGLTPGAATGMTLEAASMSSYSKEEFAGLVPSTAAYQTLEGGLAAGAAISETFTNAGEAPTLVRAAGRILGAEGDTTKFSEKYGLVGLKEEEKVLRLRQIALEQGDQSLGEEERVRDWTAKLGAEGLDIREARGLGAIITGSAKYQDTLRALREGSPQEYMEAQYQGVMAFPGQREAFEGQKLKAQTELGALLGPRAEEGRVTTAERQALGAELQAQGAVAGINRETGEASLWRRGLDWGIRTFGTPEALETAPISGASPQFADRGTGAERLAQSNDQLANTLQSSIDERWGDKIEENTEATKALTHAISGGGAPIPNRNANN